MQTTSIRDFSKIGDAIPLPDLIEIQRRTYDLFLQKDVDPRRRKAQGLEALLREIFPIVSYDGQLTLEYCHYELGKPRYAPEQCQDLRLTYGMPLRIFCRLLRKDSAEVKEEGIYLGEIPIMLGGGEFIINGAQRVIVSQLHRSPGVDFVVDSSDGDRLFHACRVIPERGSWIEVNITKKDVLVVRIDQSSKMPATMFLRALSEDFASDAQIVSQFYETKKVTLDHLEPTMYTAETIDDPDPESKVPLIKAGSQIGDTVARLREAGVKKVEVIENLSDPLLLNTLAEDATDNHDQALLRIYQRLRPGNPPQVEKAKQLFQDKFFDSNRYRLGRVGRFRICRKFEQEFSEDQMTLRAEDFLNCLKYLMGLRSGDISFQVDDIDHLGNRRLRTIGELATEELRKGFLKLRRTVQERMSLANPEEMGRIAELVNSKSVSSAIDYFFGRGELSQVVDQTNPLSQLNHERRLSALGPGGLNRKRAGFEVRDVHISHYGRICPIETPEGTNIGLIASLSLYASIDEYGFLITPYRVVTDGKVNGDIRYLRADEEMATTLAPPDVLDVPNKRVRKGEVISRIRGEVAQLPSEQVAFVDVSPRQTVGISAALIPFLEHDDANRALMGSNMQRQAVPLLTCEPPIVATGVERDVAENSGMVVRAKKAGRIDYVDAQKIVMDDGDEYELRKFVGLNERTCLNQSPCVKLGDRVKKGQVIADGAATLDGELALGKNVLAAFMTFDGYNFEDAIVVSEALVKDDRFTSIHIDDLEVEVRETKLGREEFTRDIPNVSEKALANLDENGIVRIGTVVSPGDILVGKVSPKSKTELSPEEKLLHAIFGRAGEDVKNDSLELPAGEEGIVIGAKHFSRRAHMTDQQKAEHNRQMKAVRQQYIDRMINMFRNMCEQINLTSGSVMVDPTTKQKVGRSDSAEIIAEQIETFSTDWIKAAAAKRQAAIEVYDKLWAEIIELRSERDKRLAQMKRGDELPAGVLEMVKIFIATKRHLSVGDKMAGRHGNKGVIARIVAEEDMPFLADGTPVEILLNPLGVPSRMNLGQLLETHLGWAAEKSGFQAICPVFDGATEAEVRQCLIDAGLPSDGKVTLHDGRTGEPFEQQVTVGRMYMMKLHHLVDDKVHARSTGPYSLITQQPLGGKARTGGQRFGEMEVWGLEAYGSSYFLQELLTVKSDDVEGRTKIYESMVKGRNTLEAGTPVSFDVLCNEIRGLGLNIMLEKKRIA